MSTDFICCKFIYCTEWEACDWSNKSKERNEIAEHVAANPLKLKLSAIHCSRTFKKYLVHLSNSSLSRLCQNFRVSNLTSPPLQYKFLQCTGLSIYKYFSDRKGNIRMPSQLHRCKKMSFQDSGIPTLLVSWPGSGNSWVRQLLEATTGIYTGAHRDCDIDYIKVGMLGEGISSENVVAVKYHKGRLIFKMKKVIYIVRNPYDAIVAEFNRLNAKKDKILRKAPHVSQINITRFGKNLNNDCM